MRTIVESSLLGKTWVESVENRIQSAENDIVKNILFARGITDPVDINNFLNPAIRDIMPDPSMLKDMDRAVAIVADAVLSGKKIAVFGDYDVDGITSTSIVLKYLKSLGADPLWHLPSRESEGYGLNIAAIEDLAARGAKVIVTVDCGISGMAEVEHAKKMGLSVVITDHHSPDKKIPDADAVINPKRADDDSGLDYLAGVGVAFMFLVALNRALREAGQETKANLLEYMDLVALGTICDMMPLIRLNRAFVATGLKVMEARKNVGLSALMHVAGAKRASTYAASFVLGPRINAAGRLDSANPGLELLLTDNHGTAGLLAQQLNDMNKERMDIQNSIMMNAIELAEKSCKSGKRCLFIVGDNWHKGVIGIIAGRLKDKFCMPVCVATKCGQVIDGSGRSVPGVDLGAIIHDAVRAGILTDGGGHVAAAGFGLTVDRESDFCEFFEKSVRDQMGGKIPRSEIIVDVELDAGGADMKLVHEMSAMEPFGQGNPEPILVVHGGELAYTTTMGGGQHLRGSVRTSAGTVLNFVGFNLAMTPVGEFLLDEANIGRKIQLCGRLQANEYNGRTSAQFIIEDMAI
ncbi:MAG: single-stranded-DNA-specific exonuclease RecJ [Alphaproteobacteria bacterium]|nr:single-stranded-DNA-specific exonuclease RecJ [Alphaproteobacteria bacterium]